MGDSLEGLSSRALVCSRRTLMLCSWRQSRIKRVQLAWCHRLRTRCVLPRVYVSVLQISAPTAKELAQRAVKQRAALAAIKCKEDYQSRRVHRAAMLPHGHTGEAYNCALVQSLPVDRARRGVHSLWMETCVSVQTSMNMWLQIPCFT